jgi:carbon storage regulator
MLVLSRKMGEEILIGDDIRVTVVEVTGGRVKIGIQAPNDVAIFRSELREWSDPNAATVAPAKPIKPVRRLASRKPRLQMAPVS